MSILIIGADGSMGKRYQAILGYLGRDYECVDKQTTRQGIKELAAVASGVIIATPTPTHAEFIKMLAPLGKPILCEKPVTKNVAELKELLALLADAKTPFRMMLQYKMLADPNRIGKSHYNYFRHGSDGLIWDCMQVIGLARGECRLSEASPVWSCMLNGKALSLSHMDAAYIGWVQRWFQRANQDPGEILHIHEKTASCEGASTHG